MDRTEVVEQLRKELFEIKLLYAMRKGTIDDRVELIRKEEKLNKILNTLLSEIEVASGQVAFAFAEQIDLTKIDDVVVEKKGRKKKNG